MRASRYILAALLGALHPLPSLALAEQVGVITAHNTNATSRLANGTRAVVQLGKNVYYNQTFTTDNAGRLQARLKDGSSFTLSANTSLTVDSFVYDPGLSTGKLLASVTSGIVQFIGGELSKSDGQVTIETATTAVGIRGGIAIIRVSEDRQETEVSFHFGEGLDITLKDGRSYRLTRPGTSLRVAANAAGQIRSVAKGAISANHLGAIKTLKGKIQNRQMSNQRQAIVKQKLIQSGLSQTVSGDTSLKPRLGKALVRIGKTKRRAGAAQARKRMVRRRRKLN